MPSTLTSASGLPRIVQAGDPVLRAVAEPVLSGELQSSPFRALVSTMVAVMRAAPGVGLAAPQIGVRKQVIVVEDREEFLGHVSEEARAARERSPLPLTVIVNPTIRLVPGPTATFFEGCLSVAGYAALVTRSLEVVVSGLDATSTDAVPREWRLRGWPARILQHEVDHLGGTLYVDRMHTRSFSGPEETHRWAGLSTEEAASLLGVKLRV